jgi:hypothetical protein
MLEKFRAAIRDSSRYLFLLAPLLLAVVFRRKAVRVFAVRCAGLAVCFFAVRFRRFLTGDGSADSSFDPAFVAPSVSL